MDFPQDGLQVLPYGRWSLQSGCRYSAKGGRGRCPPHIVNPSVQSGLLVFCTKMDSLYFSAVLAAVVLCEVNMDCTFICREVQLQGP